MTIIALRPDRPANGGAAVGRVDGRVVFVDGAIPGELVRVRITDDRQHSFAKAEVVEILEPSPHRIEPACPAARHGAGCCDLGFVELDHARTLKSQVLSDALTRIGGLDVGDHPVISLGGTAADGPADDGTGWRVRARLGVDADGRAGMRSRHGSAIVAGFDCAAPESGMLDGLDELDSTPGADLVVVADSHRRRHVTELAPPRGGSGRGSRARTQSARRRRDAPRAQRVLDGDAVAAHRVGDRTWHIPVTGFWQAHRAAPTTYSRAIVELLAASHSSAGGLLAWDLYGGAGVFAAALLDDPATSVGAVHVVESDAVALTAAAETFGDDDRIALHHGEVVAAVRDLPAPDVVVLDPPRTGAGAAVIEAIAAADPPTIIHVGCDVGRFARDLALFAEHGYRPREIRGFDAFPATHHIEAIAALVPVRRL